MDIEDLEPKAKAPEKRNLEPLSIEELTAYIADLEAEIRRARTAIAAKDKVRAGAEALFRR